MPSWRRSGGTKKPASASLTIRSPMLMRPAEFCSSPATMRSVVVLPQPDGPSSVTNSPGSTDRSILLTATTLPKWRLTPSISTPDI